jgi:hypothetical protein
LTVEQFAEKYHVKVRRDSCGDEIIPGTPRFGDEIIPRRPRKAKRQEDREHIYQHSDDGKLFGVFVDCRTPKAFGFALRRLLAAGFVPGQIGDTECNMLFDPSNPKEAGLAIQEAGIRIRKPASPAQLASLARTGFKPQSEGA